MPTLVIGDIHHQVDLADAIAAKHPECERKICLGDYQDDYYDTPAQARNTALWMKSRAEEDWELLMSNHDLCYALPIQQHQCPGWTGAKYNEVFDILGRSFWTRQVKLWTWCGPWLLSHAGFTPYWPRYYWQKPAVSIVAETELRQRLRDGLTDPILHWSRTRMENAAQSGFLWADWSELQPISRVCQLVGHTPAHDVRIREFGPLESDSSSYGVNICIDTVLRSYAVIGEDHQVRFYYSSRMKKELPEYAYEPVAVLRG